jgi:hypothetical protein
VEPGKDIKYVIITHSHFPVFSLLLVGKIYAGVEPEAQSSTAYKWSFDTTKADRDALAAARDDIRASTYAGSSSTSAISTSTASNPRRQMVGPTLPSASDLTLAREYDSEHAIADRKNERKRQRAEERERMEDLVGPKPVGREGQLEAKRAKRENDKAARAEKDEGFAAVDEKTLMGGGDGFRDAFVLHFRSATTCC